MAEIKIAKHGAIKRIQSERLDEYVNMGWMKETDYAKHMKACLADQASKAEKVAEEKPAKTPKAEKVAE